jgi:CTP:molybdopterin cytidylyltransferase MocA
MPTITGIVLAAGAGSRMGRPKALMRTADGEPWVARAVRLLLEAGCQRVEVVLGASANDARSLVPFADDVGVVVAERWAEGMSASLRAGLEAASGDAAIVTLVDLPELPSEVVERMLDGSLDDGFDASVLRQAVYRGKPGHPVLIGADHWDAVAASLSGDRGARAYLAAHGVVEIECGDLFSGEDVDSVLS